MGNGGIEDFFIIIIFFFFFFFFYKLWFVSSGEILQYCLLGNLNEILDKVIFKLILVTDGWCVFCEIALKWLSLYLTDDKSTLVQVMAYNPIY